MGPLTHSQSEILQHLLIARGMGVTPPDEDDSVQDWPVYATVEPAEPDNVITTFDTEGLEHGREMVTNVRSEDHGCQVRVRAIDHRTGYRKARAIAIDLDQVYQYTVTVETSQYLVHCFTRTSDVIALGKEVPSSKRDLFTLNGRITLRQVS